MIDLYMKHVPFLTNERDDAISVVQHVWAKLPWPELRSIEAIKSRRNGGFLFHLLLSLLSLQPVRRTGVMRGGVSV